MYIICLYMYACTYGRVPIYAHVYVDVFAHVDEDDVYILHTQKRCSSIYDMRMRVCVLWRRTAGRKMYRSMHRTCCTSCRTVL